MLQRFLTWLQATFVPDLSEEAALEALARRRRSDRLGRLKDRFGSLS
jgi:hypothetical protein